MRYQFEAPPAYFIHVPKTGGITLGTFLEHTYAKFDRVRLNPPRMAKISLDKFKHYRFYHAMHQGRPLLELTERNDLSTFTMLRDPLERTISQILYLQRTVKKVPHTFTPDYLEKIKPMLKANFTDLLDENVFPDACDTQLRNLGYREDYRPLFKGGKDVASGRSVIRPYNLPSLMDIGDKELLMKNAKSWLNEITVVGITEHYEASVKMMCGVLGILPPPALQLNNANPTRTHSQSDYRSQLSPRLIGQIEELTREDRELYNYALEIFQEQWANFKNSPPTIYSIAPRIRQSLHQNETIKGLRSVASFIKSKITKQVI